MKKQKTSIAGDAAKSKIVDARRAQRLIVAARTDALDTVCALLTGVTSGTADMPEQPSLSFVGVDGVTVSLWYSFNDGYWKHDA